MGGTANRRPLKSRQTGWAAAVLRLLLRSPLSANQVSLAGILVAGLGAWAIAAAPGQPILWILRALAIQLRLLANMMDGLVAVEGGRGGPTGAIWNEAPDRLEDTLFLVAFGYACGIDWLGWLAAVLAAFTAYVRLLGGTLGFTQDFRGPMAKPHRMAALTLGCIGAAVETAVFGSRYFAAAVLAAVALGTALTATLRLARQAVGLKQRPASMESGGPS